MKGNVIMKNENLKRIVVMLVVLGFGAPALGIEYFVDKDNGSDSNSGLSLGEAFQTIQMAVVTFSGGDTIYIAQASTPYYEPINLTTRNCSGTAEQYTKICGLPEQRPVISGVGYSYYDGKIISLKDKQYIELCHLEVESDDYCIGMGHYGGGADNCKIHGNVFRSVSGARDGEGVRLHDGTYNNEVYNNIFYDLNEGVHFAYGAAVSGNRVVNNLFYNCIKGVAFYEAVRPELNLIANNIAVGCDVGFYGNGYMEDGPIYNSCVYNNVIDFQGPEIYGLYTVSGDPLFVDTVNYDFHIRHGSPCIDCGMDTNIPYDFDGNARPKDTYYDIGPYEGATITLTDPNVYHVDGATGDNGNDGLSRATAFATIGKGMEVAGDGDTVLVWPGVYELSEVLDFGGEAMMVTSAAEAAVVRNASGYAFNFHNSEGPGSVVSNLILAGGQYGIQVNVGCSPTIRNLTIVDNEFGISGFADADPCISNCIFYNNLYGDIENCQASYSWIEQEMEAGLVGYWKLDEGVGGTAYDSAGSNHGTINGAAWTTGQVDDALSFDGYGDHVDCGSGSSLDITQTRTWTAWVKPYGTSGRWERFIARGYYNSGSDTKTLQLWYEYDSDEFGYRIRHDGNLKLLTAPAIRGVWQHLAATYDSGTMILYLNGAYVNETTGADLQAEISNYDFLIGRDVGIAQPFKGEVDEVAIWERVLTPDEVQKLYEAGLAGHGYVDPLFGDADNGDYRLLSERGRYWPAHDLWVMDKVTSPCVDGGDPTEDPWGERMPNGGRMNMGAYGGTDYASMSEWPLRHDGDRNGVTNLADLADLAAEWLAALPWVQ